MLWLSHGDTASCESYPKTQPATASAASGVELRRQGSGGLAQPLRLSKRSAQCETRCFHFLRGGNNQSVWCGAVGVSEHQYPGKCTRVARGDLHLQAPDKVEAGCAPGLIAGGIFLLYLCNGYSTTPPHHLLVRAWQSRGYRRPRAWADATVLPRTLRRSAAGIERAPGEGALQAPEGTAYRL